ISGTYRPCARHWFCCLRYGTTYSTLPSALGLRLARSIVRESPWITLRDPLCSGLPASDVGPAMYQTTATLCLPLNSERSTVPRQSARDGVTSMETSLSLGRWPIDTSRHSAAVRLSVTLLTLPSSLVQASAGCRWAQFVSNIRRSLRTSTTTR